MRYKLFPFTLAVTLALGLPGAALAQDNPSSQDQPQQGRGPGRMNPDRQLERMTKELDLTPDQQSQIKPLLVERQQQLEALFQDQSVTGEDRRSKMQTIRQASEGKIESILNDQQKQKFQAMRENMRRRGGNGEGGPPQGTPPPQQ
jgi:protein CpxP